MKVALVNLPWKQGHRWGVRAGSRWPHIKQDQEEGYVPFPFFLSYSASLLKESGIRTILIDALAEEIEEEFFLRLIDYVRPDLLVAETSTPSVRNDLEILKKLPQDLPIAICGPHVDIGRPEFLGKNEFVDFCLVGEYEFTLLELALCLKEHKRPNDIRGLIFRDGKGIKVNPPRELLQDLDGLPWPERKNLLMERYNDAPGDIPRPSVQMLASRGCPYRCIFCAWPQIMYGGSSYRARSVSSVVDEMEYLVHKMYFKSIYFDDDTFNIGRERMLEFCRELNRRNWLDLETPWAIMARPDLMDEELLRSMKEAGLYAVKYGVESGSQALLNNCQKAMNLEKAKDMICLTKAMGIKTHLTFTFGLPRETKQTIKQTTALALSLDPDTVQFSIITPYPGTKYFEQLRENGYLKSLEWSEYDGNFECVFRTEELSPAQLKKAKARAYVAWDKHVWNRQRRRLRLRDVIYKAVDFFKYNGLKRTVDKISVCLQAEFVNFGRLYLRGLGRGFWGRVRISTLRFRKMLSFLRRRKYLDLVGIFDGRYAYKGPDCVQIDLTNRCNNDCIGCWCNSPLLTEQMKFYQKRFKSLPTRLVFKVIDELAQMRASQLYFAGGGEPFMHKDLLEILAYAKHKGLHCSLNTNFTLVDENAIRRFIEMGLDCLVVSLWAGTPSVYSQTHPNKDEPTFLRIRDMMRFLNSSKGPGNLPFVRLYNVISRANYNDMENMVDFALENGCEAVEFAVIDTIPNATDVLILSEGQRRIVLRQCEGIKKRFAGSNDGLILTNLEHFIRRIADLGADRAQYDSQFIEKIPCYVGWLFARIMADGNVSPCLKAHRYTIGSIYEQDFACLWNSPKQIEFRHRTLNRKANDPFFSLIGNDPHCKIGCYKSCDDLSRNIHMHKTMSQLNKLERGVFNLMAKAKRPRPKSTSRP